MTVLDVRTKHGIDTISIEVHGGIYSINAGGEKIELCAVTVVACRMRKKNVVWEKSLARFGWTNTRIKQEIATSSSMV